MSSFFVGVKSLGGFNFVRPDRVLAISVTESTKCVILLAGGVSVSCSEPAKDILARIDAALAAPPAGSPGRADDGHDA